MQLMNHENRRTSKNPIELSGRAKAGVGLLAAGAALKLATMGGGEAPAEPAQNPAAPAEDVVRTPAGHTVETADNEYRTPSSDPSHIEVTVERDADNDGYVDVRVGSQK